jgi:HK97 family phage major capsid protein
MPTTAKALREQRHKLAHTARKEILEKAEAENRPFTAEENERWTKIMGGTAPDGTTIRGEVDELKDRIDRLEKVESLDAEFNSIVTSPDIGRTPAETRLADPRLAGTDGAAASGEVLERNRTLALAAWCKTQMDMDPTEEELAACRATRLNPSKKTLQGRLCETKPVRVVQDVFLTTSERGRRAAFVDMERQPIGANLSGISGPGGAYLFPDSFVRQLEINMLAYGGVLQVADIMRTESGERIAWPTVDDTTNQGARLNENTSIGNSVDPTFGQVYWDAYDYSSKPVLVPFRLLMDAIFDLPTVLGELLGIRLGRKIAADCTTGTGANQPKGITVCAGTGVTTASATAIAFDEIFDLIASVDPAYRPNGRFLMHDKIVFALRKLKDGMGRYLWAESPIAGAPDRIAGYQYSISMEMASSITNSAITMLFGDLRRYKVRQVREVRMYRLQERYRDLDQDGFIAFLRADGNMLTAGTTPIQAMVQHS